MLHPPARHQDLCNDFLHIALKDSSLTTGILVDLDMLEKWRGDPKLTPPKKAWRFRSCGLSSQLRTGDHDVSVISMCCCPKGPQRPPMYQLELWLKDHLISSPDSLEVCLHCCWPGVRIPLLCCHVQLWALLFTGNVDLEIAKEASNTHMYWKGCTYIYIYIYIYVCVCVCVCVQYVSVCIVSILHLFKVEAVCKDYITQKRHEHRHTTSISKVLGFINMCICARNNGKNIV